MMDTNKQEEQSHLAMQAIREILRSLNSALIRAYLERTGWTLKANHFTWKGGWTLQPELNSPKSWIYVKSDPEGESPFVVEVPGQEERQDYLSSLQSTIERIAAVEETTFVTVVCRVLEVEQVVLLPEK